MPRAGLLLTSRSAASGHTSAPEPRYSPSRPCWARRRSTSSEWNSASSSAPAHSVCCGRYVRGRSYKRTRSDFSRPSRHSSTSSWRRRPPRPRPPSPTRAKSAGSSSDASRSIWLSSRTPRCATRLSVDCAWAGSTRSCRCSGFTWLRRAWQSCFASTPTSCRCLPGYGGASSGSCARCLW